MKIRILLVCLMALGFSASSALADWVDDVMSYAQNNNKAVALSICKDKSAKASVLKLKKLFKQVDTLSNNEMKADIYLNIGRYHVDKNGEPKHKKLIAKVWFEVGKYYASNRDQSAFRYFSKAAAGHPKQYDKQIVACLSKTAALVGAGELGEMFAKPWMNAIKQYGGAGQATKQISTDQIQLGLDYLRAGEIYAGKRAIKTAMDNGYSGDIYGKLMQAGNEASGKRMYAIYKVARELNPSITLASRKAGIRLAKYARSIEDPLKFNKSIDQMIKLAIEMTTKEDAVKSYSISYNDGTYFFRNRKNGEVLSYWIVLPSESFCEYNIGINSGKLDVIFSSGKIYRLNRDKLPKDARFTSLKFYTVEAGDIRFILSSKSNGLVSL